MNYPWHEDLGSQEPEPEPKFFGGGKPLCGVRGWQVMVIYWPLIKRSINNDLID